jgi:hypothetical protein
MMATNNGPTVRAERTQDEMILRLPNPNRVLRAFLPEEAVKHLLAAQREQLLALRAVIDAAVAKLEAAEHEDAGFAQRRTDITVE